MQVPPQLSAFQLLLGVNSDGSTQVPQRSRVDLSEVGIELSEHTEAASFVSLVTPLIESNQLVPPEAHHVDPVGLSLELEKGTADSNAPNHAISAATTNTAGFDHAHLPDDSHVQPESSIRLPLRAGGQTYDTPQLAAPPEVRAASTRANVATRLDTETVTNSPEPDSPAPTTSHHSETSNTERPAPERNASPPEQNAPSPERPRGLPIQKAEGDVVVSQTPNPPSDAARNTVENRPPLTTTPSSSAAESLPSKEPMGVTLERRESASQIENSHGRIPNGRVPPENTPSTTLSDQATQIPVAPTKDYATNPSYQAGQTGRPESRKIPSRPSSPIERIEGTHFASNDLPAAKIVEPSIGGHSVSQVPQSEVSRSSILHMESHATGTEGIRHDTGDLGPSMIGSAGEGPTTVSTSMPSSPAANSYALSGGSTVSQSVEIAAQIVEAVHLEAVTDQRAPRLEVQLDPPELGKVWIELSEARDGLLAKITVSRADTHHLLEAELAQIRSLLEEAGVQVSDFQLGHDESRFQDESSPFMTRPRLNPHTNEVEDELPETSDQAYRYGPHGSRIDVRL